MKNYLIKKAQVFSVIFIVGWIILSFFNGVAPYLWPDIEFSIVYLIRGVLHIVINIIIAIWLIFEARKYKFYPILWGALAVFSGLLSVVIFYWVLIYRELKNKYDAPVN